MPWSEGNAEMERGIRTSALNLKGHRVKHVLGSFLKAR
jgi:hypothetical protein